MPSAPLYNSDGTKNGTIDLDAKIFGVKANPGVIEQAIVTLLANRRDAIAHTKTKAEVRGGGRKPWRQKGTGRARHGSIRSPQWKGGGVIFGPRSERNFSKKMNSTARRLALRMALSDKVNHERVTVLADLKLDQPKTKLMAGLLKKLPVQKTSLIVLPTTSRDAVKAGRNIPGLTFIRADSLNTYDVVKHQQLIVLQPALEVITATYAK